MKKYLNLLILISICFFVKMPNTFAITIKDCIDYPISNTNYSESINIQGWVMADENIDNIKAYINDIETNFEYQRYEREDVIKAIKGYGGKDANPTPGFKGNIDISELQNGNYTLKLEYYSNETIVKTTTKVFTINESAKILLDYPKNTINGTEIYIQGWIMSSENTKRINLYIDNTLTPFDFQKYERPDVIKAITGYGDVTTNKTPGFKGYLNGKSLKEGNHIIKVEAVNKNGEILSSSTKNFTLQKYKSTIRLDGPSANYKNIGTTLNLNGWYLSTLKENTLQVLIDDTDVTEQITRYKREDAIKVYGKEYNATSDELAGYKGSINMSNFIDGNHSIKVVVKNNETDETILSITRDFTLQKYKSTIRLDGPSANYKNTGTTLNLNGWFLSTFKDANIHVLIDDTDVTDQVTRVKRDDAIRVYGSQYNATSEELPGYIGTIDVSGFKDGKHTIKAIVKNDDLDEILTQISKEFTLEKYKSTIRLDGPSANYKNIGTTLSINGWCLSTSKDTTLKVLLNNTDVTEQITRVKRDDAINAYGNQYNATSEELPGYNGTIDVSDFSDGNMKIEVIVINNQTNETLISLTRNITLKKYDGVITIDFPSRSNFNKSNAITVQGWVLAEGGNSTVEVYLDNKKQNVIRYERPDVLNVYPTSYGGAELNPTPGFTTTFSLNSLNDGMHKIKVILYNKLNEKIEEKIINIYTYTNAYFGIDVSSHQGNINWQEVKLSGIDFAIIRAGYGSNFTSQDDIYFKNNVSGATTVGIPYGVYLYSYATLVHGPSGVNQDSPNSDSEAAHMLRQINSLTATQKANLKLPVFIDMEESRTAYLGSPVLTTIADNFCTIIQNNNYKCGVYANKNWLNNYLNSTYLASKYDIWLAHYTAETDYTGTYQIWQYSSNGTLRGINSNGVDLNISYKKYW